jgi:DtxR family Mn-dependent transcriptional regulator
LAKRRSPARKLTASLEDYLEAILAVIRQKRVARVRDIADRVGVGMPSVTAALKTLAERGLVNYEAYRAVTLTARGREVAEEVSRRHVLLRRFLVDVLGLDAETAEANACRMEHAVDEPLLERLARFAAFLRDCPRTGEDWIEQFADYCKGDRDRERCRECVSAVSERLAPSKTSKRRTRRKATK